MPKETKRLSSAQAALVEENYGLAIFAIKKHNDLEADFDELLGLAFEGLCEAAQTWKASDGCKFSPYAVSAILWKLAREKYTRRRRVRRFVSLDAPNPKIRLEDGEEDTTYLSRMTTDEGWDERAERRIDEARFETGLSDKEKNVLALLKQGLTLKQTGNLLEMSYENVRLIRNKIREKRRKAGL